MKLTCIVCPRGCTLEAQLRDGAVTVTGNGCPKGEEYAQSECLHPVRTVTATVRVANRPDTMVSVKTETPVAKASMAAVMAALRHLTVNAPIPPGAVLSENICGSRIVATKEIR
jgi:CxxC motif-containing protein